MSEINVFPERVWEPTGIDESGKTLWSSRAVTREDTKDRARRLQEMMDRIEAKRDL